MYKGNMAAAFKLAEEIYQHPQFKSYLPTSSNGALARALVSYAREYRGDLEGARAALKPYLYEGESDLVAKEDIISQIQSPEAKSDVLIRTSRLFFHARRFQYAAKLLEEAIQTSLGCNYQYGLAVAYYRIAQVRLHQFNYYEAERCASKSIEIIYENTMQAPAKDNPISQVNLAHKIALCKICLGVIAERQGFITKAKTELYTAQQVLRGALSGSGADDLDLPDPVIWADLHSALGRIYAAEGNYDSALKELYQAVDIYARVGHALYETRARLILALTYIRKLQLGGMSGDDRAVVLQHLQMAQEAVKNKLSYDARTQHLLNTVYAYYYLHFGHINMAEKAANAALQNARKLESHFLLSDSYRVKAELQLAQQRLGEARSNLQLAIEHAEKIRSSELIGAALLVLALSYCSKVEPNPAEVDKYLDRFDELKASQPFENYYLDQFRNKIRQERIAMPSGQGFYFTVQDLQREGLDRGMSRFILWAVRAAERLSHGDSKRIAEILHFGNLTRTYNYIKKANAIENQAIDKHKARS